jgi:hypothetical protein
VLVFTKSDARKPRPTRALSDPIQRLVSAVLQQMDVLGSPTSKQRCVKL